MSTMQEIFRTDPLKLTQENKQAIIMQFRSMRHQFDAGNMKAGSTKPKTAAQKKQEADAKIVGTLDLDALGLDL